MSTHVEVRLQLAAVTLAEELNFTRAADRLKITQPALSKQIIELESRVGFTVFKRDQRRVEITEAGQIFVQGCRDSLAIIEKATRTARATQEQIQPVVTIGYSPYTDPSLIASALSIHLPLYPNLRLRMESMFALDLVHSVLAAELDLALIVEPVGNPLLTLVPIASAPLYAAMPADHRAANQLSVTFEELGGIGWLIFPRKANPGVYDKVLDAGRAAGVAPVELHHYVTSQEATQLISENFGVALIFKGAAAQFEVPEIAVRAISHKGLEFTSYLVLRADQSSRLVNEFGRAFLKKVQPNSNHMAEAKQMLLDLK